MSYRRPSHGEIDELIRKRRRIRIHESRKSTIRWIGIIILVAALTIGLLNLLPPLLTQIDIMDKSYAPRDMERYKQLYKMFEGKTDKAHKELLDKLK